MRVKIGNKIYTSEQEPIMVILSDNDKRNISNMPRDSHKYCAHPAGMSADAVRKWMHPAGSKE